MTFNTRFWKHVFTILVALNLATAIASAFLQQWWLVSESLGGACLMAGIGIVIVNGKATKHATILFIIAAIEHGVEVARDFLAHQYSESIWSIAGIVLCVYWMKQYYVEDEQHD